MKYLVTLIVLTIMLIGLTVLAETPATKPAEVQKATMIKLRQLALGVTMYVNDNRGYLPKQITQLRPYLADGDETRFQKFLLNPRTGASPGYLLHVPAERFLKIKHPDKIVLVDELLPNGEVDSGGFAAFMDAHVEKKSSTTILPASQPTE